VAAAAFEKIIPKMTFEKSNLAVVVYQPTVVGPTLLEKILDGETGSEVDTNESTNQLIVDTDKVSETESVANEVEEVEMPATRSGRSIRAPTYFQDYVAYNCELMTYPEGDSARVFVYSASTDPDVLYPSSNGSTR
jgi:hypothetical protein